MIIKTICFSSMSFIVLQKWVYTCLCWYKREGILLLTLGPILILLAIKALLYSSYKSKYVSSIPGGHFLYFSAQKYDGNCSIYIYFYICHFLKRAKFLVEKNEYSLCSSDFSLSKAIVGILHWIWWLEIFSAYHILVWNFNTLFIILIMLYLIIF